MRYERGFTLVELLTALVLFGIVGTALYQLLVSNQRVYRQQSERVAVNENARAAISILPGEIRELSAGGGDVIAMTATSLSYKAMQGLYLQCQLPNTGSLQLTLDRTNVFGLRGMDPGRDSVLVFAENDPSTRGDDAWLHADVTAMATGTACPGARPSLTITLAGVTAGQLGGVENGAPVRTHQPAQVLLYQDAAGAWWLGGRMFMKGSGWSATQPIVGPVSSTGLALSYFDVAGNVTANPAAVARVGIAVESRSARAVRGTGGAYPGYMLEDLMTHVAVRNNPLY
ncbi:MAG: prepilin-type N-terminal cleavage/methylation domain-containing protein [Gemmatimonadota bacterium]|nr:prepilin-type N-terminal cleavage/methylation domain-containing protein [Gemmatimonadota bacterium]